MVLGAAIGGAVGNVPSWSDANTANSVGGVLAAMLEPAGGFGKFVIVLIGLSPLGNTSASLYSVSLNLQMMVPMFTRIPRALFSIVVAAIFIPVSIKAAVSFYNSLENFIGIIGYWSAAFVAAVLMEHVVFRRGDFATYKHSSWNTARELPSGIAGLSAAIASFGLVIPCMYENWYVGLIAETTGDIGFEMAFCITALLYLPLRYLEIRMRGRL
jgi:purine-cytosine permease-like protein